MKEDEPKWYDFNERVAICMFDGGLKEEEAMQIAVEQVFGEGAVFEGIEKLIKG